MHRRLSVLVGLCMILTCSWAAAQDYKYEFNGRIGYTFSEGVEVNPNDYLGSVITKISPNSGFTYGMGFDYFLSEQFSIGFNWNRQQSKLRADVLGLEGVDFTDMSVDNYHAIFTYNFFDEGEFFRPFVFGGLGATHYGPDKVQGISISGATKFSTTWGGGVKYYTSDHLGFKGGIRWTPTYINSNSDGIYCSPHWPWECYIVSKSNYSHQFELSAGILVRF